MIAVSKVAFAHGARTLFRDVSFQLPPGRRVALVGGNGVGKTTLLEIVVGLRRPGTGVVSRPSQLRIGYLPQGGWRSAGERSGAGGGAAEAGLDTDRPRTVLAEVLRGAGHVLALEQRLRELEERIATAGDAERETLLARYGRDQHRFEQLGGFRVEAEAHRVLAGLGFAPHDGERALDELSGGWRMRVGLARLLLEAPDLLVLDEPTNHLDLDTIRWLEQALADRAGGALFVSHDRDLIDAVAQRVVEVSAGTATEYVVDPAAGAFADFVAQREAQVARLEAARRQQDRDLAATERFVERFRYKASKARQVQSRVKALERVERVEVPDHRRLVARFGFEPPRRSGRVVATLAGVDVGFDGLTVLRQVDLTLERGWKVAVLGPNGAGKTTLLRLLAGALVPDAGAVTHGHNVDLALFTQHTAEALDPDRTVLEELRSGLGERHRARNHRSMLGAFGFGGDRADQRVASLSGGEQTRLALAKLMAHPVNLLCLDEPTNHLDIPSRDVLEDALLAYPGTVALVTHDRHVIRAVADHVLEVRDGGARLHAGGYEDHLARQAPTAVAAPSPGRAPDLGDEPTPEPATARRRDRGVDKRREAQRRTLLYRHTRDLRGTLERVETMLEQAEAEVAELTRLLAAPDVYADKDRVKTLVARHTEAKEQAARLMGQWEQAQLALDEAEAEVDARLE